MATKNSPGAGAQGGSEGGSAAVPNVGDEAPAAGSAGASTNSDAGNSEAIPNLGDDATASESAGGEGKGASAEAFEFKVPEGFDKDSFFDGFADFAKAEGLSGKQAQKLAEHYAGKAKAAMESVKTAHQERVAGWWKELQADKEIGGDKFKESWALAKQGLDAVGDKDFKALLQETGLGSHRTVVRVLAKIGRAVAEDSSAGEGGTGGPERTPKIDTYEDLAKALGYS